MTTTPTARICRYCHATVELDWDAETGAVDARDYHSACLWEGASDGRFEVVTTQNGVTPPRVAVRRFLSMVRAREVAAELRSHNRREWPCGAQLDIVVRERIG